MTSINMFDVSRNKTSDDPNCVDLLSLRTMNNLEFIFKGFKPILSEDNSKITTSTVGKTTASCKLCGVAEFSKGFEEQREHFKSRWHLTNLSLSDKGKKLISEEESKSYKFEEEEDEEMSEEYISSSSSDNEVDDEHTEQILKDHQKRGPTKIFKLENDLTLRIYGAVASNETEFLDLLTEASQKWGIILYQSGHFACAIFENGKIIQHKTEHRYTQRKKQGGSQASHDSRKSKAKSAGAQLRRYGEQTMRERVTQVLGSFSFKSCSRVFLCIPERARPLFFATTIKSQMIKNDVRFSKLDDRFRKIPFMTARPTLEECERVFKILSRVELFNSSSLIVPVEVEIHSSSKTENNATQSEQETLEEIQQRKEKEDLERLKELGYVDRPIHEAVERNDVELVRDLIKQDPNCINSKCLNGDTPLHIACAKCNMEVLDLLLEEGGNLEIRDLLNRTPYQRAKDASVRNRLRDFREEGKFDWDWKETLIPEPVKEKTEEELRLKKEKEKEKKKRQAERKKQEKAASATLLIETKSAVPTFIQGVHCDECKKSLPMKKKDRFSQGTYEFCSSNCMRTHSRNLATKAIEKRLGSGLS